MVDGTVTGRCVCVHWYIFIAARWWIGLTGRMETWSGMCERLVQVVWESGPRCVRGWSRMCRRLVQDVWEAGPGCVRGWSSS